MSSSPISPPAPDADSRPPDRPRGPLRRLYAWTLDQAERPGALWVLAGVSFVESSVFPIPPDVLLIPMVLAARQRAWVIAAVCTLSSVLGGLAGYAVGLWLWDSLGAPLMAFYGYGDKVEAFQAWYHAWGAWIVAGAGLTPFPFKVVTIASGAVALSLPVFLIAALLSRGARFFLVAGLLWRFGPPLRGVLERRLGLITALFFLLLLGGFLALKALH